MKWFKIKDKLTKFGKYKQIRQICVERRLILESINRLTFSVNYKNSVVKDRTHYPYSLPMNYERSPGSLAVFKGAYF